MIELETGPEIKKIIISYNDFDTKKINVSNKL